jgi:hypothetical protein
VRLAILAAGPLHPCYTWNVVATAVDFTRALPLTFRVGEAIADLDFHR